MILTIIHGSLIYSDALSVNYDKWITGLTHKPISSIGNGILKTGSTINDIFSSMGIYSISRNLNKGSLLIILALLCLVMLLNIVAIWNINLIGVLALKKPTRRGKVFMRTSFQTLMTITYKFFIVIFPISMIIGAGTLSCRWIDVATSSGDNDSVLSRAIFTSTFISA